MNSISLLPIYNWTDESQDLVGWEESNIMHPQAIKGIIGELAAVLGPKLVKESAVQLF